MKSLLQAMAAMEGFYKQGTRPNRNNNPGDLEYGSFAREHGAVGTDGRFAFFPNADIGFAAMRALLVNHYGGLTIEQALNKYAPPVENNTNHYLDVVCQLTGLSPNTLIDEALKS